MPTLVTNIYLLDNSMLARGGKKLMSGLSGELPFGLFLKSQAINLFSSQQQSLNICLSNLIICLLIISIGFNSGVDFR